jgi:maltooligosyltrehalose trehalohydrolase
MSDSNSILPLGASKLPGKGWRFSAWAPSAHSLSIHLVGPANRAVPMERLNSGYFYADIENVEQGARYFFRFEDGRDRPDPASRFQPEGVHGPSELTDLAQFTWTDSSWRGQQMAKCVFYEVHVGTYTPEGTFEALIPHLAGLRELGITTLELMPVAQFPGTRNWGYDGVQPYAPQNSY